MNERFVAVSTVMGSKISGCFSKTRCEFSVSGGNREPSFLFQCIAIIVQHFNSTRYITHKKLLLQHFVLTSFSTLKISLLSRIS